MKLNYNVSGCNQKKKESKKDLFHLLESQNDTATRERYNEHTYFLQILLGALQFSASDTTKTLNIFSLGLYMFGVHKEGTADKETSSIFTI